MTDAPFRDLFVELPRALFESLQAIGEAAVAESKQRPEPTRTTISTKPDRSLFGQRNVRLVLKRYDWRDVELQRDPRFLRLALVAMLACGHRQRFQIDEVSILRCSGPRDEIDLLDRIVDSTPRRCYCVPLPEGRTL